MNWKFLIGKSLFEIEQLIIRTDIKFVRNNFPFGRNWIYDVKRLLKEQPQIIVDAGANYGFVSKELSFWFPSAVVYAFEPVAHTFQKLCDNLAASNSVFLINMALGEREHQMDILLNPEHTINSLKNSPANSVGQETINIIRLDHFLQEKNIQSVNILKIDVEGYEFEVLNGATALNIDVILLEVGYEREPTKVHFSDVETYMEAKGYQLCGIYELTRNLNDKRKVTYSNNLYVRKEILEKKDDPLNSLN